MLDGSKKLEVAETHAYRTRQVEYINCLSKNLRHLSRTWYLLGIASQLSWFQCLSSICIVKFTFNMSPRSSSKWHIYSYIPVNKDQIYCCQCTANPCQFRLQFWLISMSSPLNVFSDITIKCFCFKKASFGNTVIIKAQNNMCADWGMNDMICFIESSQLPTYVPLVPYHY